MNPTQFRIAIYGVWVRSGRLLMTRTRTKGGLILNFPGGALEHGEHPVACLTREFKEETGLVPAVGRLLYCSRRYHINLNYPDQHQYHTYYLIEEAEGEPLSKGNGDDVAALEWVDPSALAAENMLDPDREFVAELPVLLGRSR